MNTLILGDDKESRCPKGHVTRGTPFSLERVGPDGARESSGPVCWACITEFMKLHFPTVEIKKP